jgi:hypothetical protein
MPFKNEGFPPELNAAMSIAYDKACTSIQPGPHAELAKEILAKRIIVLAQQGHTDADKLYAEVLKAFDFDRVRPDPLAP